MKTLIKNGLVLTSDFEFKKTDILIENDIIKKIGNINSKCDFIIDAQNKIVLPGFINSHIHFGECFIRGYKGKLTTNEYIEYAENINIKNKDIMEKMRVISTEISILESMSYGSTTMMGIRGFDTALKSNGRFYFGYPFMKSKKLSSYLENAITNLDELIKNKTNENYFIFIHSLKWVDESILSLIEKYFQNNNILLAIHIEETKEEKQKIKDIYGLTPLELLKKYHLLNDRTLLVHSCFISDEDIKLIKISKSTVCVCPISNLKLKNKIPPIQKLIDNNINILLGTDGGATNDSFSLLEEIKLLSLLTDVPLKELFKTITSNASAYYKENIGLIKENYKADLIFFENDTTIYKEENILENLIYRGQEKVSDMIINGKLIIKDYKNLYLDKSKINKEKNKIISMLK